jgi:hypothetical protein
MSIALTVLLSVLAVFQISLALGAPFGHLAWGGQSRVLPTRQRVGSVVSVVIYGVIALIALDWSGQIEILPDLVSRVAMWAVVGFLTLSIVPNLLSKSVPERAVMAPVSSALAILALLVALN